MLIMSIILSSCSEDEDDNCCDPTNSQCANYDPCFGKEPTASFRMRGTSVGFPVPENLVAEWCDTIFNSGVEFTADMEDSDIYEWHIGNEIQPRYGRSLKISFSSYTEDTLQNLNPDNQDFFKPLEISLIVRNDAGGCVNINNTVLTTSSNLIFTREFLSRGTFIGRVEGEDTDREVTFWRDGEDLSNPAFEQQYFSDIIGLTDDTIRYFGFYISSIDDLVSYKKLKWEEELNSWWIGTDGIRVWDQEIITSQSEPNRVELYYERFLENSTEIEIKRFSGVRIK